MKNSSDWRVSLERARKRLHLSQPQQLTTADARSIISSLRTGVPPHRGVLEISVDRDEPLSKILEDVKDVASGSSRLLFINGEFGAGKSHLLYVLREFALARNLAVSHITLSHRECPLHDLLAVYQHVVQSLEVPGAPKGQALEAVLEQWAIDLCSYAGGNVDAARRAIRGLPREFCDVLATFYQSTQARQPALRSFALSWLRGEASSQREVKQLGVAVTPSEKSALWMLGGLARMIRFLKLSGLVILLDEAETLASISRLQEREVGYRNLRHLIESSETPFCYFVYATTPDFIDQSSEFMAALRQRPTVLEVGPLGRDDLTELSVIIKDLHLKSYAWSNIARVRGSRWLKFARQLLSGNMELPSNRSFVRGVIAALDLCQQNPQLLPEQVLSRSL